jgi:putative nucleotidyltransferase with HDIG domain
MSIFRILTKQIKAWGPPKRSSQLPSSSKQQSAVSASSTPPQKKQSLATPRSPLLFVVAVVTLTSVVGHRFYNQPELAVGTAAPQTIYAPDDAVIEDAKSTEERRRAAQTEFAPVLKIDQDVNRQIHQDLEQAIERIDILRQQAAPYPFTDPNLLAVAHQETLYYASSEQWQLIQSRLQANNEDQSQPSLETLPPSLQDAATALATYQRTAPNSDFEALLSTVATVRRQRPLAEEDEPISLETLTPEAWQATKINLRETVKRILAQGISPGLPDSLLASAVTAQLNEDIPTAVKEQEIKLLLEVLQPNLTADQEKTKALAEQTAQNLEPELVTIQSGEVIVAEAEEITRADFVLLDHFDLSRRSINWSGILGSAGLVTTVVGVFVLVQRRVNPRFRYRDYVLVLGLSLSTPLLVMGGIPYANLAAVGLLISSFYGPALGVTAVGLLSGLTGFSTLGVSALPVSWAYLLAGAVGGMVAAAVAGRLRSREELAFLGGIVGVSQGSANLIFNLILSASAGTIWYVVLPEALIISLSGVAWSIVALGVSPYLERLFDLVTPTRLAELANPNRPLLKRLATEAPGTFQHTLFVASLAEAAARELHCNVELVRAGTLYHDIGKMHDAQGFIENQMGGPNKHDQINDPWASADIIKRHVSEGLVMARRCGLPQAIRDFIPEHQGTLLISYFYFKAKELAQQQGRGAVCESDFRYNGPTPQSRETGIVMLADACEAALRSLKEATPKTALTVVQKILKARWQDHQLVDSGLRWEELPKIAEIFVRVWQQSNHQRIAYPKAALEPQAVRK